MTPSTIAQLIDSPAAPSYEWLWTHYKWMHQHPELSLEEEHTAAYIPVSYTHLTLPTSDLV